MCSMAMEKVSLKGAKGRELWRGGKDRTFSVPGGGEAGQKTVVC